MDGDQLDVSDQGTVTGVSAAHEANVDAKENSVGGVGPRSSSAVELESLASRYDAPQHQTYLARLNQAIQDDRNRNVALTGRYGAGKSSILDEFERTQSKTRRLAISTLAPDDDESANAAANTTNRIQKELVKQLIYSATPGTLRHSRFSRSLPLPGQRTFAESAAVLAVPGLLLALLGWLPSFAEPVQHQPWLVKALIWLGIGLVLALVVTVGRFVLHDRYTISDFSAAGATVKLSPRTPTYFDEYLDDIVNYFDAEDIDIVILEDLDRFDEPRIFEALRELNTLLNSTPARVKSGTPLRFVYAVRDSLFERLGSDVEPDIDDAATIETVRANRTKFFDTVIPVVPFISHRNAQDLLAGLFEAAGITGIDRRLVDLVSQHSTDMRLLRNMRNEYLVFAERLLEQDRQAPGLDPTKLFALVAYKNFHLEDFEQISRKRSTLDRLYDQRRDLVRGAVAGLERDKRELINGHTRAGALARSAKVLGARLQQLAEEVKADSQWGGWSYVHYQIGGKLHLQGTVSSAAFWKALAKEQEVIVSASVDAKSAGNPMMTLSSTSVAGLFPELTRTSEWLDVDEDQVTAGVARFDRDIAFLRGAEFDALAADPSYTLTLPREAPEAEPTAATFLELIELTIESALGFDLITRGYIDRNYALYAAQFYGDFTGTDVANFIVQSVQTNTMDVDYTFTSVGAVENLLQAAGEDFTFSVAALNPQVVDYLLAAEDDRIDNVLSSITSRFDSQAQTFLAAYMSTGHERTPLVARLSLLKWPRLLTYLSIDENIDDDLRTELLDAALLSADPDGAEPKGTFDLGEGITDALADRYGAMQAFTDPQGPTTTRVVIDILSHLGLRLPEIAPLSQTLREEVVGKNLYPITAANLRAALSTEADVSLDNVMSSDVVYHYCLKNPSAYLAAAEADDQTDHPVLSPDPLARALTDIEEDWDQEHVAQLIKTSSPDCALPDLSAAPSLYWQALAGAHRIRATLANVDLYRSEVGTIDAALGGLLIAAGRIWTAFADGPDTPADADEAATDGSEAAAGTEDGEEGQAAADAAGDAEPETLAQRTETAVALLNAGQGLPEPQDRLKLVRSLGVESVPVDSLEPEPGTLLSLLIDDGLIPDEAATFAHFQPAGWAAFEPAIRTSAHFAEFMTPDLVSGLVGPMLDSSEVADKVGAQLVLNLANNVPEDDPAALRAAGLFASRDALALPVSQVRRIAAASDGEVSIVMTLILTSSPEPTAAEIVAVLAELGAPYSYFSTRQQDEFEVPQTDPEERVVRKLEQAGLCSVSKKRLHPTLVVKLT